jgi:E1A/CREB-binding protein
MHLVVNMAEHTSESLKLIEKNHNQPTTHAIFTTSEAGTVRVVRTVCKALERRGDEKSGCPMQFAAYLKKRGISKNPLIHFKGNRFNILFANGARIYYMHQHIADFLKQWGTPNRLLQAVLEDISYPVHVAGCNGAD